MTAEDPSGTTFTMTGGAGSIRYTVGEIAAAGSLMRRVAERLAPLVDRVESEWRWLLDPPAPWPALPSSGLLTTGPAAHHAQDCLRAAVMRCRAQEGELLALAVALPAAAANYLDAEARLVADAAARSERAALARGLLAFCLGPLAPLQAGFEFVGAWRSGREQGLRDGMEDFLRDAPAYAAGLLGVVTAGLYLRLQERLRHFAGAAALPPLLLRQGLDWAQLTRPGTLSLRAVPPHEWQHGAREPGRAVADPLDGVEHALEPSLAGILEGSRDAYGYPPGSLGIDRVDRPDGSRAWIVNLPGTEVWGPIDSPNPWDLEGDLEGMTAADRERFRQRTVLMQEFMKQALRQAGALPDEEVLLAGHSGGGIHAAAAAADPAFLAEVNVRMIILAGAPASQLPVSPKVTVLALENEHDIVTALDRVPPPDTPTWLAVTSHRPPVTGGGADVVAAGHAIDNYVQDARELAGSDDPAMDEWRQRLAQFLGPVAVASPRPVRRIVFQGWDVNELPVRRPVRHPPPSTDERERRGGR